MWQQDLLGLGRAFSAYYLPLLLRARLMIVDLQPEQLVLRRPVLRIAAFLDVSMFLSAIGCLTT